FADAAIGKQSRRLNMSNGAFVRELSDSRTFCRQSDVEAMQARGLALGGTLENAVVFDGDKVLSPGGLRHKDEPVRHKMLDALGDLALAGAPLLARYTGIRAGHALTNRLLRELFATPDAFTFDDCDSLAGGKLPGIGVHRGDLPLHA
ncbi:MAG: UDP-3-O-acyl-N-acetylglucosamine deacetylase, partial [Paracoccaceae bacterium]